MAKTYTWEDENDTAPEDERTIIEEEVIPRLRTETYSLADMELRLLAAEAKVERIKAEIDQMRSDLGAAPIIRDVAPERG